MEKMEPAVYVWVGGDGRVRSKTRVVEKGRAAPAWDFDGSSTGQASGKSSEVAITPVLERKNPFAEGGRLVMCALEDGRRPREVDGELMFGFEQEFFVVGPDGKIPECCPGSHYCGVGGRRTREIVSRSFTNAIRAGLSITGMNAEVGPSQWEIQLCAKGVAAADELWLLRYILRRTAEAHGGCDITLHPKLLGPDHSGSGLHTNVSTLCMRSSPGSLSDAERLRFVVGALQKRHALHMKEYGKENHLRLTGKHETSRIDEFTWGIADRTASIRLPANKRYLEDRRPAANANPYDVVRLMHEAAALSH